jgi:hypothetical protein
MKKNLLLLLTFSLLTIIAKAQDFPYGEYIHEEIAMQKYDKDTSAHAVVLNEFGKSRIDATNDDKISLIYQYHVKIKIFDKEAFDQGNVEIHLYSSKDGEDVEEVSDIKGVTTYTDDNGMVRKTDLDASKTYRTKDNMHWSTLKFAMPALRNGCVIEYSYQIVSPYFENFHPWLFQSDIPKVYSEYDVHIPAFWTYNASIRGALKLTKNVSEVERDCFSSHGAKCDCSHMTYGISNIPAFIDEDYMTAGKNFLSAIYFELAEYTNPYDGTKYKLAKEWKDVDYELKHNEDFGSQLRKKDFFKDKITPVIAGKTDDLDKAKAIYAYIQKNIKWNDFYATESEEGIRKALDNHTGNVADINLSLAAALGAAGLNAEAVLLSTRDHGVINRLYPVVTEFDYVITKVDIGDKSYLLDATDKLMPFGMLPLRCLNDQGRVMSLDKPSYWIDLNTSQRESNTYTLDLTLQPDGKIKGTVTHYSIGYAAYEEREKIKRFNSVDEYVEDLNAKSGKYKILKSDIENLDSLDLPLSEKYEVEISEYKNMDHDRLGFNPFILDRRSVNPFKLAERSYPVDWGMPSVTRFSLTMHLPDEYVIESNPQNVNVALPNNGGRFLTSFENIGSNTFTFSHVEQFNKSIYAPEEYPYLKELYNNIILSEKAEIIFKKK